MQANTWQTESIAETKVQGAVSPTFTMIWGDLGWQTCRTRGKEEQDPSPEGNSLECEAKDPRPCFLSLGERATDLNGVVRERARCAFWNDAWR